MTNVGIIKQCFFSLGIFLYEEKKRQILLILDLSVIHYYSAYSLAVRLVDSL